jgi:predicted RecA/RadA family phage recombinase
MQATFVQEGCSVDHTPSGAVDAGDVVVVNGHIRIAKLPIAASALGALASGGLFKVVKDSSNISDGNALYWDADGDPVGGTAGTGAISTTSTNNTFFGFAQEDAGTGVATVKVRLIHVPSAIVTGAAIATAITDPGASGAIPVTGNGSVQIVSAGAETRTLAAPSFVGQELLLCMKTDGGDCVITCATGINQTGNNTITMNDAGDSIRLNAIQNGANIRWRVVYNDGCTLSTV